MANTLLNPSVIAQEALFHLENNLVLGSKVHREYKEEFVKVGATVTIRKPVKFVVSDGATRVNQDVTENSTSITINKRKHVSFSFSTQDLTLTVEEYSDRYIKPAMIKLANQVDMDIALEGALNFHNLLGSAGTDPSTFANLADVSRRMDEIPVPDDGNRCFVTNPAGRWGLAKGLGAAASQPIFNSEIVGDAVRKGALGSIAGLDVYGNQNINRLTFGSRANSGSVGLVNDTVAEGDTSVTFDAAASNSSTYFRQGDVIEFDNVFAVNDVSKDSLTHRAQFVVTADTTTASLAGTVSVYPEIRSTGAFQTVSALPADNAQIFLAGQAAGPAAGTSAAADTAYAQNLAFHRNALALVMCPLELPDSAQYKARADWNGFSVRIIKDYDIDSDDEAIRVDIFYGVKAIYPELGLRYFGS